MKRDEVFKIIDDERGYQQLTWGASEHLGVLGEVTLIRKYLRDFDQHYALEKDTEGLDVPEECLNDIRKIAAICVRCMENNGARRRKI